MAEPAVPGAGNPTGRDRPWSTAMPLHRRRLGVLCVLGAIEAIMGRSGTAGWWGPVPAAALGCCAGSPVTCLARGLAMRSLAGRAGSASRLDPCSSCAWPCPNAEGSVVITNTAPASGTCTAALSARPSGIVGVFALWIRRMPGALKPVPGDGRDLAAFRDAAGQSPPVSRSLPPPRTA